MLFFLLLTPLATTRDLKLSQNDTWHNEGNADKFLVCICLCCHSLAAASWPLSLPCPCAGPALLPHTWSHGPAVQAQHAWDMQGVFGVGNGPADMMPRTALPALFPHGPLPAS